MSTRKNAKIAQKLHRRLKALAKTTGQRMDFMIDEALLDYLSRYVVSPGLKKLKRSNDEE